MVRHTYLFLIFHYGGLTYLQFKGWVDRVFAMGFILWSWKRSLR